jgi:hypothetical protein
MVALGALAGALALGAGQARAQISVSPVIVPMTVGAQTVTKTISVTNSGTRPVSVRFYAGDFEQDQAGENRYGQLGAFSNSCGSRIRVRPDGASLLPGETQSVSVEMDAGAATCWSAVFVETNTVTAGNAVIRQRIAAKVYGVRPGGRTDGEVTGVTAERDAAGQKIAVTFRNLGDVPLRPAGTLEIHASTGELLSKAEIAAFSVLPGRTRTVLLPLAQLRTPGEFLAVPVLDFGGAYLAGGQVAFTVAPSDVRLADQHDAPQSGGGERHPY